MQTNLHVTLLVFPLCSVAGDGDSSVLERLPLPVRAQVPEAGRVPGQPATPSPDGTGATGAAAG